MNELVYIFCYCILFMTQVKAKVPAIYVFGDSLADVGNNDYLEFSFLKANFPHNGVDYPGGKATGRFSNGKNCADFLAERLGLPSPPPYLSIPANSNITQVFLKGVNFASGGAGVLDSTRADQCLKLTKQIDYYSTMYTDLVEKLGFIQARDHISMSIFAFIIGSNDILDYVKSSSSYQLNVTAEQLVGSMISSLEVHLKRIYNLGARKIIFVGTGPIGCCPQQRENSTSGECSARTNSISAQYDSGVASLLHEMKSEFNDMNYSFFNSSSTLMEYIESPDAHGFTDVKAACCGIGNLNALIACLPVSRLCEDRTSYVFWDLYHPTEATARLLTETMFSGSRPYVFPINVKQLGDL
ncbi:GDSL esterase/lipase At5g55050-like isoform X2 [Asparagus officinalis]|uniref:GDSL esterase/lipase At5g55050-like isoform X2 n=1 Tax=Asparagus officinalis TaxID=4686 RepID=UPI00098E3EC4|nr:GDSL esterase/lipase At5g55050-like isoform X2 [Asparagus officinalis]